MILGHDVAWWHDTLVWLTLCFAVGFAMGAVESAARWWRGDR